MSSRAPVGNLLVWYGVLGAPVAWALAHLVGVGATDAGCSPIGVPGSIDGWALGILVIAGLAAAGAEVAAILTFLATRESGEELPASRIHFLAVIGMMLGVLFLALILMAGIGALFLPECVQS